MKMDSAKGHSGGLLLGIRVESFEIEHMVCNDFFLVFLVRNIIDSQSSDSGF